MNLSKWLREGRNVTYETTGKWFNHWLWDPKQDFLKPHHEVTMVIPLVSDEDIPKRVKARWNKKLSTKDPTTRYVPPDSLGIALSRQNIIKYIKKLLPETRERLLSLSKDQLTADEIAMSGREKIPAEFGDPPVHNLIIYDNTGALGEPRTYTTLKLRSDGTDFKLSEGHILPEQFLARLEQDDSLSANVEWFAEALKRSKQVQSPSIWARPGDRANCKRYQRLQDAEIKAQPSSVS